MIRRAASRIPRSRIPHALRAESHRAANNERTNVVFSHTHVDSSHNPKPLMTVHRERSTRSRSARGQRDHRIGLRATDDREEERERGRSLGENTSRTCRGRHGGCTLARATSAIRRRGPAGPEEEAQERDVNASRDPNFLGQPVARARGPCDPPKSWIRCRGPVVVVPVTSIPSEALQSQRPMPKNRHACTPGTFTLSRRPRETMDGPPMDPAGSIGRVESPRVESVRSVIAPCFDRDAFIGRSNGKDRRARDLSRLSLLSGPLDESRALAGEHTGHEVTWSRRRRIEREREILRGESFFDFVATRFSVMF